MVTNRTHTPKKSKQITPKSVKERVILAKIQNPRVSLKEIALKEKTTHCYARQVWSKYKRNLVTIKGGPIPPIPQDFPFFVQNQGFTLNGPPRWYLEAPLAINNRKNLQKVHKSPYYSIVFHTRGSVQLYVYHMDWQKELKIWLSEWMHPDDQDIFFDFLIDRNGKHYTVNAPGVPRGYKFTIPGVGTFATDSTPFKKGTIEFEVDPGFDKRLHGIESAMMGQSSLLGKVANSLEIFGEGMRQHMVLITSLQGVSKNMMDLLKELKEKT